MTEEEHEQSVAIVTSAGRGLGRSMVLGLARAGIHVIATAARERNEIEAVAGESAASKAAGTVVPVLADVTRARDCERIVDTAVTRFGRYRSHRQCASSWRTDSHRNGPGYCLERGPVEAA